MESVREQRKGAVHHDQLPGVAGGDRSPEEVEALLRFIRDTGVDMIQMRNLSIDPDFYNKRMGVKGRGSACTGCWNG